MNPLIGYALAGRKNHLLHYKIGGKKWILHTKLTCSGAAAKITERK
jgi:hypothetical protein